MLEVEIQKLTAAIQEMTVQLKGTNALLMEARANAKTVTAAEKSYREDDAARMEMQRKRDESAAKPVEEKATKKSSSKKTEAPEPEKTEAPADITADTIKTLAMELVRADSSARQPILEILDKYGAKTIAQLDPKHYGPVHHALLGLAKDIFNKSEEV